MAKKKASDAPAKKPRTKREPKDSYMKNNFVEVNNFDGVVTHAMHIRGVGSIIRDTHIKSGSVTSVFVPMVKIKTKKDYKYMIIDKGPKNKKGKDE